MPSPGSAAGCTLPQRCKWTALVYALLAPALLFSAASLAQRVDTRQLTADRAARLTRALTAYHQRTGSYPTALRQFYHSENGQVSAITARDQALLIFPDGRWERMIQLEQQGQAADQVDLIWVDTDRAMLTIPVSGHLPRGCPMLDVRYLPGAERLLLSSSNGVSLVSAEGELLHFWKTGSGRDPSPWPTISPDGKTVLLPLQWDGLFRIPVD